MANEQNRSADNVTIAVQGSAQVASSAILEAGCLIRGAVLIEENVYVGPYSVLDNSDTGPRIHVREGVRIGAHSTIWPGVTVDKNAVVEPGSVVTKNVPATAIVAGNPAQIIGYAGAAVTGRPTQLFEQKTGVVATDVKGVNVHYMPVAQDLRGSVTFGEVERHVPFPVKRYFLVYAVTGQQLRGEHAHRELHQFLICVNGRIHLVADDGTNRQEFILDRPSLGVHLPPMTWGVQYRHSADAVLLVLASDFYDAGDYIRDYTEFAALASARNPLP